MTPALWVEMLLAIVQSVVIVVGAIVMVRLVIAQHRFDKEEAARLKRWEESK